METHIYQYFAIRFPRLLSNGEKELHAIKSQSTELVQTTVKALETQIKNVIDTNKFVFLKTLPKILYLYDIPQLGKDRIVTDEISNITTKLDDYEFIEITNAYKNNNPSDMRQSIINNIVNQDFGFIKKDGNQKAMLLFVSSKYKTESLIEGVREIFVLAPARPLGPVLPPWARQMNQYQLQSLPFILVDNKINQIVTITTDQFNGCPTDTIETESTAKLWDMDDKILNQAIPTKSTIWHWILNKYNKLSNMIAESEFLKVDNKHTNSKSNAVLIQPKGGQRQRVVAAIKYIMTHDNEINNHLGSHKDRSIRWSWNAGKKVVYINPNTGQNDSYPHNLKEFTLNKVHLKGRTPDEQQPITVEYMNEMIDKYHATKGNRTRSPNKTKSNHYQTLVTTQNHHNNQQNQHKSHQKISTTSEYPANNPQSTHTPTDMNRYPINNNVNQNNNNNHSRNHTSQSPRPSNRNIPINNNTNNYLPNGSTNTWPHHQPTCNNIQPTQTLSNTLGNNITHINNHEPSTNYETNPNDTTPNTYYNNNYSNSHTSANVSDNSLISARQQNNVTNPSHNNINHSNRNGIKPDNPNLWHSRTHNNNLHLITHNTQNSLRNHSEPNNNQPQYQASSQGFNQPTQNNYQVHTQLYDQPPPRKRPRYNNESQSYQPNNLLRSNGTINGNRTVSNNHNIIHHNNKRYIELVEYDNTPMNNCSTSIPQTMDHKHYNQNNIMNNKLNMDYTSNHTNSNQQMSRNINTFQHNNHNSSRIQNNTNNEVHIDYQYQNNEEINQVRNGIQNQPLNNILENNAINYHNPIMHNSHTGNNNINYNRNNSIVSKHGM